MTDKVPEGKTHAERMHEIDDMEHQGPAPCPLHKAYRGKGTPTSTREGCVCRYIYHWHAHCERLRLIYQPFPAVRRVSSGSAMPWAGTVVGDTFFGGGLVRPYNRSINADTWREIGEGLEWDDYVALANPS